MFHRLKQERVLKLFLFWFKSNNLLTSGFLVSFTYDGGRRCKLVR